MNSLSDRLKALGVQVGARQIKPPSPAETVYSIDKVVEGEFYPTIYGSSFITKRIFTPNYLHGHLSLSTLPHLSILSEWSKSTRLNDLDVRNIAFLDTETSGLAGGTGTFAFLVGVGYHTGDGFQVVQFFMRDPSEEQALLAALNEWMSAFDVVVTFNGKSFDIPLLNTRYTMNGISSPFSTYEHVDLLHLARRLWRDRLPSRALGDLEKEIMGFYRDQDEVPGYLIPQYYFDYLRTADARPLAGVFYHNVLDIVSLAALFNFTGALLSNPGEIASYSLDIAAIARLNEELGHLEHAAELYEHCIELGLPEENFLKIIERFAQMRKRQQKPELAAILWLHAVERKHIPAFIELAKYYEHTVIDLDTALSYVTKALTLSSTLPLPGYLRKMYQDELNHRAQRLEKKIRR
jgi:uncharacterized protein YprB with RNaseH-like and TPR domain